MATQSWNCKIIWQLKIFFVYLLMTLGHQPSYILLTVTLGDKNKQNDTRKSIRSASILAT